MVMLHSASRSSVLRLVLAALLVALTVTQVPGIDAGVASAQEADEGAGVTIEGTWVLSSYSATERRRDAGVERCVDALPLLYRPIARSRITDALPIHRRIRIRDHGARIHAVIGEYDMNFPYDGSSHDFTDPAGEHLRVTQQYSGERLIQRFVGEGGGMNHTLSVNEDGTRLTLRVSITSSRLPRAATYQATYRRAG